MKGEIEVFEFLRAKSCIKGININDLQELLTNAQRGKQHKGYMIKMLNYCSILIFDSNNSSNILLKCIKDHYCTNLSCPRIRKELGVPTENENSVINCSECYVRYIEKIKNGEI